MGYILLIDRQTVEFFYDSNRGITKGWMVTACSSPGPIVYSSGNEALDHFHGFLKPQETQLVYGWLATNKIVG